MSSTTKHFDATELLTKPKDWVPIDAIELQAQSPNRHEEAITVYLRQSLQHSYAHARQPTKMTEARLVPGVLLKPNAIFSDWKEYSSRGFPGSTVYMKEFTPPQIQENGATIEINENGNIFVVIVGSDYNIQDYGFFEKSNEFGLIKGYDNPNILGEMLWRQQ